MKRCVRIIIYVALVLSAAVSALVTSSAAAVGAVAFLLLLPLSALLWNLCVRRAAEASLQVRTFLSKGEAAEGTLTVRCGRRIPAGLLSAAVECRNELTGTAETVQLALTPQDRAYTARFSFSSDYCGRIRLAVSFVFLSDVFSLLRVRVPVQCVTHCTVLPNTFSVEIADPSLPDATQEADAYLDAGGGSDYTQVYQLRPYVPGDNLRGMHWKLSSKHDTLIYRDPHLSVQRSLLLFWDKTPAAPAVSDALAEAVFSVAQALSEQSIPFTLAIAQADALRLEPVTDTDTLLPVLPMLLRGACKERPQPDVTRFGRTLWFTSSETAPCDDGVTVLRCADAAPDAARGVVFTPETVRRALHRLDWDDER